MESVAALAWLCVAAAVLGGLCAIGFAGAPARRPAMSLMLVFGTLGMLLGSWADGQRGGLLLLAGWCGGGDGLGWRDMRFHWLQLPGMHVGMLVGGLLSLPVLRILDARPRAWPFHLACNLFCCAWMTLGMNFAAGLCSRLPGAGTATMLMLMLAGMVAGMVASRGAIHVCGRIFARIDLMPPRMPPRSPGHARTLKPRGISG